MEPHSIAEITSDELALTNRMGRAPPPPPPPPPSTHTHNYIIFGADVHRYTWLTCSDTLMDKLVLEKNEEFKEHSYNCWRIRGFLYINNHACK